MSYNHCGFHGRLVADPELRTTQSGIAVATFCVAVDRAYAKDGQRESDFLDCVAWRGTAEFVSKYFHKGSGIIIGGALQTRTYEKDGQKRKITEVVVENVDFAERAKESAESGNSGGFVEVADDDDLPF